MATDTQVGHTPGEARASLSFVDLTEAWPGSPRAASDPIDWFGLAERYIEGASLDEVARHAGRSRWYVRAGLIQRGIVMRPRGQPRAERSRRPSGPKAERRPAADRPVRRLDPTTYDRFWRIQAIEALRGWRYLRPATEASIPWDTWRGLRPREAARAAGAWLDEQRTRGMREEAA